MERTTKNNKRKALIQAGVASDKISKPCTTKSHFHSFSSPNNSSSSTVELQDKKASFESLPTEIFYRVIAYLGPTSTSLCQLSQLTREYNSIMTNLGCVMVHRALWQFGRPLVTNIPCESSISLFVRYARFSKEIQCTLEILDDVSKMDFSSMNSIPNDDDESHRLSTGASCMGIADATQKGTRSVKILYPSEVLNVLNIALYLLGCTIHFYIHNLNDPIEITKKRAAKSALEVRVSNLCSKIGAKAYSYAKSRVIQRQEREDHVIMMYNEAAADDVFFDDEDDDDEDDVLFDEQDADEDLVILDKACRVMQCAFLRQQQSSARHFIH